MKARSVTSKESGGGRSAFTMVEVLAAAGIAAVSVATAFSGFTLSHAFSRAAREDLRATQILAHKTESIRLLSWKDLESCPARFADVYDPGSMAGGATMYSGTICIGAATNLPDNLSYKSELRLVTVSLCWTNTCGGKGVAHSRSMQTLAARRGLLNCRLGGQP
jgi:type II secretory pathway pseudopilin PulG